LAKDVYRLAAELARKAGVENLVDLGCGRGEKLLPYADTFHVVGYDYGENITYCHEHNHPGTWVSVDLNTKTIHPANFDGSVIICADVIEHLPDPMPLIQSLHNACRTAKYVLLSTPDRFRVYKGQLHYGPPGNPYHVREWTNSELVEWLRVNDLPVQWHGWTSSNDNRPDQVWTSLIVMSKTEQIDELPARYEPAIEWNPVIE